MLVILLLNIGILIAIGLIVWFLDAMGPGFAAGCVFGIVAYETLHRVIYGKWL